MAYSKAVSQGVISVSNKTVLLKQTTHFINAYFSKCEIWECYLIIFPIIPNLFNLKTVMTAPVLMLFFGKAYLDKMPYEK